MPEDCYQLVQWAHLYECAPRRISVSDIKAQRTISRGYFPTEEVAHEYARTKDLGDQVDPTAVAQVIETMNKGSVLSATPITGYYVKLELVFTRDGLTGITPGSQVEMTQSARAPA